MRLNCLTKTRQSKVSLCYFRVSVCVFLSTPNKTSVPKSFTPKKSLQNSYPNKSPHIRNCKPKKGLLTILPLFYQVSSPGTGTHIEVHKLNSLLPEKNIPNPPPCLVRQIDFKFVFRALFPSKVRRASEGENTL